MAIKPRPRPIPAGAAGRATEVAPKSTVPVSVRAREGKAVTEGPKGRTEHSVEIREFDGPTANLGLGRSFTIKTGEDYVKVSADVHMPFTVEEMDDGTAASTVSNLVKELLDAEAAAAMAQYTELTGNVAEADDPEEPEEEEPRVEEDDDRLTPASLATMKRAEIETAIEEYGLNEQEGIEPIDPDDFPKTKAGTQALRDKIIEAHFSDDETEEEEEEEPEEEPEEEEEAITEEEIRSMKRPELIALIQANKLEVDPTRHSKLSALQDAVAEQVLALQDPEEEEEEPEEEPEEEEEEEQIVEAYTEAGLKAMSLEDLKAIFAAWTLGKFPPGSPVVQKKLAIGKILKAQEV